MGVNFKEGILGLLHLHHEIAAAEVVAHLARNLLDDTRDRGRNNRLQKAATIGIAAAERRAVGMVYTPPSSWPT